MELYICIEEKENQYLIYRGEKKLSVAYTSVTGGNSNLVAEILCH
jgi:hypothetical protein